MAQLKSGTRIYGTATIDTTIILNGTSVAVSTNSGALRVVGGVGIGGALHIGNGMSVAYPGAFRVYIEPNFDFGTDFPVFNNIVGTNKVGFHNVQIGEAFSAVVNSTSPTTGRLVVYGGVGIGNNLFVGANANIAGISTITNTTAASSTLTGALQVRGGVGIGGSLYVEQTGTFGSNIIIGQGSGGSISGLNTLTVNTIFYQSVGYFTSASTATLTLNVANGMMQKFTLTNSSTSITMPSASPGANFMLMLSQDGTGGRLVSSWSSVLWPSNTTATLTTTANKTDIFSFFSDGTRWYGITVAQNF